jgi:NAD(P)-dependent dehydrogenase (short-subunit alcohol dehydrogenase family)
VAIVTGAASGIGLDTSRVLAAAGASVVLADIDTAKGQMAARELRDAIGVAQFIRTDVTSDSDAAACIDRTTDMYGALHILVNNAGVTLRKSVEETTPEEWDHVLRSNAGSCFLMSRHAIPAMRRSGGGSIIHVASWHARATIPRFAAYAASKGAIVALTRQMALDCGPYGIRVNAVAPGIVDTPRWRAFLDSLAPERRVSAERQTLTLQPLGRIGAPVDIARAILFLVSDLAGYVNGTTLHVDGGMGARLAHV